MSWPRSARPPLAASSASRPSGRPATKACTSSDNPCGPGPPVMRFCHPHYRLVRGWQPLPTQRSRGSRAAHPGRCAAPTTPRARPRRAGPPPGRRTTPRPAPRSSANDRPPDAPQVRRPALPRADRLRTTPTSRCSSPFVNLAPLASPAWIHAPGRRAGRQRPPEHPGRYAHAAPGSLRRPAQRSPTPPARPGRPRRTQLDPHGQTTPARPRGLQPHKGPIHTSLREGLGKACRRQLPACT